ncbi:MAG: hypothetical protein IJT91_08485, partial [Clostridia bacterium]|nr:hypothetical protein [Clostridia bacterium]
YDSVTGYGTNESRSTVEDLVILCKYACSLYKFTELSDMPRYDIPATEKNQLKKLYNRNYFISTWYNNHYHKDNAYGLNAGYNGKSGSHIIAASRTDTGLSYITVAMNAPNSDDPEVAYCYEDALKLMKWAESNFGYITIIDSSQMICEIPVKLSSNYDHVALLPKDKISAFLPIDTDIEKEVDIKYTLDNDFLYAPVIEGTKAGTVSAYVNGNFVGETELVSKSTIERSFWLLLGSNILTIITSPLFILAVIVILALTAVYVIIKASRSGKKK